VCGYLITTAHIYALGLYGLVDFSKDYFLLEGAKFVLAIVIGIAQVVINPVVILIITAAIPFALGGILARRRLIGSWQRIATWYSIHAAATWITAVRFAMYCALLLVSAVIAFGSLRAISFHLQVSGLLYSFVDAAACKASPIPLHDAFLCARFEALRAAFNRQLWSTIVLIALCCIAWHVVAPWRSRAWLIGPLVFVTALLVLMLPMEFGVLLKPSRYPLVRVESKGTRAQTPAKDQFLIDRNERGLTVWDPATRRVYWIPAGDVARMETIGIRELFQAPARR
jgi:hypothetical protein